MYDMDKLYAENEDGITILFYLQKIYPGGCSFLCEFPLHKNFLSLFQLHSRGVTNRSVGKFSFLFVLHEIPISLNHISVSLLECWNVLY